MDRPRSWQRSWRSEGIDLSAEPVLRVGGATIDPVSRDATFADGRERLQPQNLKVLIALVRRKGQVMTRNDLIDLCWDGRIVGEDVINHAISVLRAFAARAGGFAIETVPKAGYRLVETAPAGNRYRRWAGLLALAAAVAATALLLAMPRDKQGQPLVPTVAIVPFQAPAGDPAAAAVARAVRASLSHMLADGGVPIKLVDAPDSRSDFVVTGDINHVAGKIEVMVRLAESRHQTLFFSRRFESAERDAAKLPDQIGAAVAGNLSWTGALMILDQRHPNDPRITAELLKQLALVVEGRDILRAYEISRQIAGKAPNSAIAQLSLAFNTGFVLAELPREQRANAVAAARRASDRARALAPEFGDVYIPWCVLHSPVLISECEARLREGMRADPDAPFTNSFLSRLVSDVGRFDESLELARISVARNPYMPAKLELLISRLEATGHQAEADEVYARADRWWPDSGRIYWGRLIGLLLRGDYAGIEEFAAKDNSRPNWPTELMAARRSRDAERALRACNAREQHPATEMLCLLILADLGQLDEAFATAERMYPRLRGRSPREEEALWLDNPDGYPLLILSAPSAAALRRDRRFVALAERIGLLDYWRSGKLPDFCRKAREPICSAIRP